jgi:hypothetical protein
MLSKISWSEYITGMLVLLFVYYLFVILKYYRTELKDFASGKLRKKRHQRVEEPVSDFYEEEGTFEALEMIVNDLRYSILERIGKGADRQELLSQMKARLSDYEGMRKPAFRVAINNYIIQHAQEICGVVFSEEELEAEWGILPR